jgi:hypothetical protein
MHTDEGGLYGDAARDSDAEQGLKGTKVLRLLHTEARQ